MSFVNNVFQQNADYGVPTATSPSVPSQEGTVTAPSDSIDSSVPAEVTFQAPAQASFQVPAEANLQVPAETAFTVPAQQPFVVSQQPAVAAPVVAPPAPQTEQYFQNATVASTGDPHETFSSGKTHDRWNSMRSHRHLLESNSFGSGGYNVSSKATAPNARGITHNKGVTIATDHGQTRVSMNDNGTYSITSGGQHYDHLHAGQTVELGNGESVTLEKGKSGAEWLGVDQTNGKGGRLDAKLQAQGGGVNFSAAAHDVDLGGYLVQDRQ